MPCGASAARSAGGSFSNSSRTARSTASCRSAAALGERCGPPPRPDPTLVSCGCRRTASCRVVAVRLQTGSWFTRPGLAADLSWGGPRGAEPEHRRASACRVHRDGQGPRAAGAGRRARSWTWPRWCTDQTVTIAATARGADDGCSASLEPALQVMSQRTGRLAESDQRLLPRPARVHSLTGRQERHRCSGAPRQARPGYGTVDQMLPPVPNGDGVVPVAEQSRSGLAEQVQAVAARGCRRAPTTVRASRGAGRYPPRRVLMPPCCRR